MGVDKFLIYMCWKTTRIKKLLINWVFQNLPVKASITEPNSLKERITKQLMINGSI